MEPELPDLPNKPTRLVSYCPSEEKFTVEDGHTDEAMRSYGLQCYRMGVEAERESLPVQWVGKDGTSHEVTLDYAAEICRWVFDTHGDVDEVDATIRGTDTETKMTDLQHFDDARIRNIVNAITAAAWHHRDDQRAMQRVVEQVVRPFLQHPEAAHGWVRVPYQHIGSLLNLVDPAPMKVADGKTYVFNNPMATEVLTRLSAEVRAMVDAMKGPQDG